MNILKTQKARFIVAFTLIIGAAFTGVAFVVIPFVGWLGFLILFLIWAVTMGITWLITKWIERGE